MQAQTALLTQPTMSGMIRNRVSEMAGRRRMQIADLHKAAGVSYDTAKRFWTGKAKGIDFDTLAAFCQALDCTVSDLLEFVPDGHNGKTQSR